MSFVFFVVKLFLVAALLRYGVSGLKPGSVRLLVPSLQAGGLLLLSSPVVSLRNRVITPPFMAEIISAISMRL